MIDDGSTDDSALICNQYVQEDDRFKYFKKENGGQANARNFGIEHSIGEFIAFVDQDDVLHPEMYKVLIEDAIDNNASVSSCGYLRDFKSYDSIISTFKNNLPNSSLEIFRTSNEVLLAVTRDNNPIAGMIWNKIYSRDIIGSLRFDTDTPLVDDAKFSIYLFSKEFVTTYRNITMYHWVQHQTNQTYASNYIKCYKAALTFKDLIDFTKTKDKIIQDKLINQYLQWLMLTYKRQYKNKNNSQDLNEYKQIKNEIIMRLKESKKYKYVLDTKHKIMYTVLIHFRFIYNFLIIIGL